MNLIESFLNHTNFTSQCKVSIDNQQSFSANISIKFVFLIVSSPENGFESVIFLPDYGPAISFGEKASKIILFVPINMTNSKSFTIENEKTVIIDQIFQLSTNAILTLNSFLKQIQTPIELKQHVIATFPPNNLDRPVFLILKNNKLKFDDNGTNFYEIEINTRTDITFSGIGSQATVGISDKSMNIIHLQAFPDESTMKLFLILIHTKYLLKQEEKKKIDSITAEKELIEYQNDTNPSSNVYTSNENDKNENKTQNLKWNSNQVGKDNLESLEIKTTKDFIKEKNDCKEIDTNNYLLQKEEERKEKYKSKALKNDKIKKLMEQQLLNYKPKEKINNAIQHIPQIEYPKLNQTKYVNPENIELNTNYDKLNQPKHYTKEEIKHIINTRLKLHRINLKHYFKNPKPSYILHNYSLDYNEKDKTSFLEAYKAADPQTTYKMLIGIVLCDFKGKSIAEAYSFKGKFDTINDEAYTIVESFGTSLPQFILSNRDNLLPYYRVSSIIHDKELLEQLPHKEYITKTNPIQPLYSFSHKPILDLHESIIHALFSCKIGKLDPFQTYKNFSRGWSSFFSNNIRTNMNDFFTAITKEVQNNETWEIFQSEQEIRHKTAFFLLSSLQEEKLYENTILIFNYPKIIGEHYNPCAEIRNKQIVEEFLLYTHIFTEFHIKITYDGVVQQPLPGKDYEKYFV